MTTEQTKSPYQLACEQECENCRTGYFLDQAGSHRVPETWGETSYEQCTAPSKDAFMERQAAQLAAMQAALAKAGHARDCQVQTEAHCANCHKILTRHFGHGFSDGFSAEWNDRCRDDRGRPETTSWSPIPPLPCNCYLSTLSDDIERGKELLGAKNNQTRMAATIDAMARVLGGEGPYLPVLVDKAIARIAALEEEVLLRTSESQRQAVEIEELRKDKARLDWREANPCHGFGKYSDGTWADGKGGSHRTYRDAVSAAMKEKP